MRPDQQRSRKVHGIEIQSRITALPGKSFHERIFAPVYEVRIFPPHGIETRMEIVACLGDGIYHHSAGKDGI